MYPRCTQTLLPVCEDICLEYNENCFYAFRALPEVALLNPIAELFILNCTNQFTAFGSVNIDVENCYDFYCKCNTCNTAVSSLGINLLLYLVLLCLPYSFV